MQFKRPNCEGCIKNEVCGLKQNISLFKTDLEQMAFYKGKTYVEVVSDLTVQIICPHYIENKNYN